MFAPLLDLVRADIDRQIDWAKAEVRHQTRHTALIGALAVVAALAALGAIIAGLIALYLWLSIQLDPFAALGMIGGGLLALALILFAFVFMWRRPRLASRPQLQIAQSLAPGPPLVTIHLLTMDSDDEAQVVLPAEHAQEHIV